MSLAESQEFFALNPDDLSGPAEQDRSGGSIWPTLRGRLQQEGVGSKNFRFFVKHKVKNVIGGDRWSKYAKGTFINDVRF